MISLQWAFSYETHKNSQKLTLPFKPTLDVIEWLQKKQIVIAGNGITTGKKIAHYFTQLSIPYTQTNSQTYFPDKLYKQADIIITGVGKHIIHKSNIKKGVVLLNFGLRKELESTGKVHLKGDYDEDDIKDDASLYTITPNGLGPIDVLCLYGNLLMNLKRL